MDRENRGPGREVGCSRSDSRVGLPTGGSKPRRPTMQGCTPPRDEAVTSPPTKPWSNADRRFQNVFSVP